MATTTIRIDHDNQTVTFPETEVSDELVVQLFDDTSAAEREELYDDILRIGAYAHLEDRIGAFLAKTAERIGGEFEYLKLLFEARKRSMATTEKGAIAEDDVEQALKALVTDRGWEDSIVPTGNSGGELSGGTNKTGDLLACIGGVDGPRLVLEVKFDKSINLGDLADAKHEQNRKDTAWSQLVEAAANRKAGLSMIVFDKGSASSDIKKKVRDVTWLPGAGLAVMVDPERGDYRNLEVAYGFARALLLATARPELDAELLSVVVSRALREVQRCLEAQGHVDTIVGSACALLADLEQSNAALSSIQELLETVDGEHPLTGKDLFALHEGDDVRATIDRVEKELDDLVEKRSSEIRN